VVSFGGGLVAGDAMGLHLTIHSEAAVALTTQATTKVFKSFSKMGAAQHRGDGSVSNLAPPQMAQSNLPSDPTGKGGPTIAEAAATTTNACTQTLYAEIEPDGLLAIVPHAVTCYADARFRQRQVVQMRHNANLILVDWLTSGRMARGEEWAFESYETSNDIFICNQLLVHEAIRLSIHDGSPSLAEKMRGYNAMATIIILGPALIEHATRILKDIGNLKVKASKEIPLLCTASPIHKREANMAATSSSSVSEAHVIGAIVKIAARKTSQVIEAMHKHLNQLWNDTIGDDPYAACG